MSEDYVIKMFDRFHDVLGFDKPSVYEGGFPDGYVYKNGKKLTVEFEWQLGGLWNHYIFAKAYGFQSGSGFVKRKNFWYVKNKLHGRGKIGGWFINTRRWNTSIGSEYNNSLGVNVILDPDNKLFGGDGGVNGFTENPPRRLKDGSILYPPFLTLKSLSEELDLVVCWHDEGRPWIRKKLIENNIQLLELQKELSPTLLEKKNIQFCIFCDTHKTTKLRKFKTKISEKVAPICARCYSILNNLVDPYDERIL